MGRRITLITADELRTIIDRADAELREIGAEEERVASAPYDRRAHEELSDRAHAANRALAFCVEAAGWLRDPSFLPFLARMARDEDDLDDMDKIACSVGEILAAGAPANADVRSLARHENLSIRLAVASHLAPRDEAAIRILYSLATGDPWDHVRAKATLRLGGVRDIVWWEGKFSQDPLRVVSGADAESLRAPLETVARILALSEWEQDKRVDELRDAIAALPDTLAIDVLTRRFTGAKRSPRAADAGLFAILAARSPHALLDVLTAWARADHGRYGVGELAERTAPLLARDERLRAARSLLDRSLAVDDPAAAALAACTAAALWPSDEDPTPVLDAALDRLSHDESDAGVTDALVSLLRRKDLDVAPIAARVADARVAGYPAPWKQAPSWGDAVLDRAPVSVVRPAAERAIDREDGGTVAWGLLQLAGRCHDPQRDPPAAELLAGAYADPKRRATLLSDWRLCVRVLPLARNDLRAGRLGYTEAVAVMNAIDLLWGGLAHPHFASVGSGEAAREARRLEVSELLGPAEVHCPPTEAEWRSFRALRDAALAAGTDRRAWSSALRILPDGPWIPEDRALVLGALAVAGPLELAFQIMLAISARPDRDFLPVIDEVYALDPDETMARERAEVRAALGMSEPEMVATPPDRADGRAAAQATPVAPARDWMDEPDDDL